MRETASHQPECDPAGADEFDLDIRMPPEEQAAFEAAKAIAEAEEAAYAEEWRRAYARHADTRPYEVESEIDDVLAHWHEDRWFGRREQPVCVKPPPLAPLPLAAAPRPVAASESPGESILDEEIVRYAAIDIVAIQQRRDRALPLWYLLRAVDRSGRGVAEGEAIERARNLLGWKETKTRGLLQQGHELLWIRRGAQLFLRAPHVIALKLGIADSWSAALIYQRPLRDLVGRLKDVRANLVTQGYARLLKGHPIAKASMGAVVRRCRRTIQRYKDGQVRIIPNYSPLCPVLSEPGRRLTLLTAPARLRPRLRFREIQGQTWAVYQIGDSFETPSSHGLRSLQKRVQRRFETSCDPRGAGNVTTDAVDPLTNPGHPVACYVAVGGTADRGGLWARKPYVIRVPHPATPKSTIAAPAIRQLREWNGSESDSRETECIGISSSRSSSPVSSSSSSSPEITPEEQEDKTRNAF